MTNMYQNTNLFWKQNRLAIGTSAIILITALLFHQQLYGIFGEQNYLGIHFIIESFIITICFTIAIQLWLAFPHTLSSYRLWIGALFFAVGFLQIAHALTYKGMPFFISESTAYKATWFYLIGRLTEAVGILAMVLSKDRLVHSKNRWWAYIFAFVYSCFWIIIIYFPNHLLPELVIDGVGTTPLKNGLQYSAVFIELLVILVAIVRFRLKDIFSLMLIVASVYLMISDYFFTSYRSVYDIIIFIGHLFNLAGFYFLQRAVYHSSVEEPFEKQKLAEQHLLQSEKFLQTITSHMGEGLIVMNKAGELTYMNLEAERILGWSQEELIGKNVHDYIHRTHSGSQYPNDECPNTKCIINGVVYRVDEDYFIQKEGRLFPVSYVVTPLFERDHVTTGSIMVFRDINQQKKDQEKIKYMAFYDELTKLPKFRFLKEKLAEIIDLHPQKRTAIFVLDINRFKNINEALGHSFGDLILEAVATRLREQLSENMFLGRLTGDEFALILPTVDNDGEIVAVVEQIQKAMKDPLRAQHLLLNVSLSIGAATYPEHGEDVEELVKHANIALMEAQQQNVPFRLFELSQDGKALDRFVLENDLHNALSNGELHVVYQPQVDIKNGEIFGLEALIRWNHPQHGWISPAEFIPIAEDNGLIIPIGEWVLRTACSQMKQWRDLGLPPLIVGVNLSIRQFYQQNLAETIKNILEETKLPPEYLELELTESMMMNVEHTMSTLQSLKELGIHISIDDFGTGYSSLSYLRTLPVDRLKIDQSFIRDLFNNEDDTTIVSTIISLARHLNLEVIAEGVETSRQKEFLQIYNCWQAQGYLFSRPLTPDDLVKQFEHLQQKAKESVSETKPESLI